jgi:hypothetical protein
LVDAPKTFGLFVPEANSDAELQTSAGDHIDYCYNPLQAVPGREKASEAPRSDATLFVRAAMQRPEAGPEEVAAEVD